MDACATPTTTPAIGGGAGTATVTAPAATTTTPSTPCKVQQVARASSDQLLRKFAELDPDPPNPLLAQPRRSASAAAAAQLVVRAALRTKRAAPMARRASGGSRDLRLGGDAAQGSRRTSAEFSALLPTSTRTARARHRGAMFRRGRRAREIAGIGYVLDAIEKTWRRTIEGASRVFVERHCNAHARLISDIV